MDTHRPLADEEGLPDLAIRATGGHEAEDLALPLCEPEVRDRADRRCRGIRRWLHRFQIYPAPQRERLDLRA